ncbi:flagellum-specific peptidoglycan hydrolase FlgJ [Kordia periserrulae]|uniref:Peptidoglycan hydrolase n=1 Tax=Kordia periserrulae TaxID=701523 RepID=A0A2T6BRN9_9FLAO|nr:glucosaminidase domain-containing protein [Kordia periserrulae]PTX58719.1 flagellum-specific peptidoglycan hydrolase FlgJ [Kordia periserrulae]
MKKQLIYTLLGLLILSSCGTQNRVSKSKKKTKKTTTVVKTTVPEKEVTDIKPSTDVTIKVPEATATKSLTEVYIETYSDVAKREMELHGIPASITLAQGILESGSGKGELTLRSNNHFGIKCHKGWKGERVYHDDDEDQECFRKYANPAYSFTDHSLFLTGRSRYAGLFKLPKDDYKGWARGLKKAGYATDRKYPNKLISLIERYELYKYDAEVLGKKPEDAQKVTTHNDRYTVKKGDTLYSIARKHKITVAKLKSLNGLETNDIFIGQVLFVKPLPKDF